MSAMEGVGQNSIICATQQLLLDIFKARIFIDKSQYLFYYGT